MAPLQRSILTPHSDAIRLSPVPVQSCIDPFGGSGTTALACQLAGVAPTTIEVNPYLADLIEAKLHLYDPDTLVRDLASVLHLADKSNSSSLTALLPSTFVEPGVNGRWLFNQEVADRILSIREATDSLPSESNRRLLRVLLGGTVVHLSNAIVNGKGRRYRRGWASHQRTAGDVDLLFTNSVSSAIAEITRFANRPRTSSTVIMGDARTAIRELGSFDVAVFSPPYPNSFDYTDVYNIELWMLGYLKHRDDNRLLRTSTLSSHVQIKRPFSPPPSGSEHLDTTLCSLKNIAQHLWNRYIPQMVGGYFAELLGIIETLQSKLAPGGNMWLVVGDSSYADIPINVAHILAQLSATRDLRVIRQETLRELRKSAQQGGQIQLAEKLLVLTHT